MMRPPCSFTMPCEMDSPSPVPWPSGLVVKKGSNTWRGELLGHAGAVVDHIDGDAVEPGPCADHDGPRPAGGRDRLRGIVDQVDQHLLNLVGVGRGHRQLGLDLEPALDPLGHELVAEQEQGGVEQRAERRGLAAGGPACGRSRAGS